MHEKRVRDAVEVAVELGRFAVEKGSEYRSQHSGPEVASRMISMRVPEPLLDAFKAKCELKGLSYQRQIKALMLDWLQPGE